MHRAINVTALRMGQYQLYCQHVHNVICNCLSNGNCEKTLSTLNEVLLVILQVTKDHSRHRGPLRDEAYTVCGQYVSIYPKRLYWHVASTFCPLQQTQSVYPHENSDWAPEHIDKAQITSGYTNSQWIAQSFINSSSCRNMLAIILPLLFCVTWDFIISLIC